MLKQHSIELGGKKFPVRFTKGSLSRAEFELNIALIGPGAEVFWDRLQPREDEKPEESARRLATTPGTHYCLAVLIYAGINAALPFDQVLELAQLEQFAAVMPAVLDFFQSLGLITETTAEGSSTKKAANSSGSGSGPSPESHSESPAPSSGSSPRDSFKRSPIAIVSESGS